MKISKLLTGALFGAATLAFSIQAFAQADVIEKRQKLMKGQGAAVKELKGAIESKNYATVEAKAKDIMGSSEQIPSLFPKGSTEGKTRAKAEIWEKNEEFVKYAKTLNKSASELAAAAKASNDAEIATTLKSLGNTCDSCHKDFRAPAKSQ